MSKLCNILKGAFDLHIHCGPDLIPRSQDVISLAQDACKAGMGGIGLKDHTGSTAAQAYILNKLYPNSPKFFGSIALNPPVGGLNPAAVQTALSMGAVMVYFPTYSASRVVKSMGKSKAFPMDKDDNTGITILEEDGEIKDSVLEILTIILKHDAVLATGHLSPVETLKLLERAKKIGINRMIATHVSQSAPGLSIEEQIEAVSLGAFIEQSFLVLTDGVDHPVSIEEMVKQIRIVGVDHVILSSDFGKANLEKPILGFGYYLNELMKWGISPEEIDTMISRNPRKLLQGK